MQDTSKQIGRESSKFGEYIFYRRTHQASTDGLQTVSKFVVPSSMQGVKSIIVSKLFAFLKVILS